MILILNLFLKQEDLQIQNGNEDKEGETLSDYKERGDMGKIDSKTLKYQFQSLQIELKKQIEQLQQQSIVNRNKITELETALTKEKQTCFDKTEECAHLKRELGLLEQKWKESCNEMQQMRDKILSLNEQLCNIDSISFSHNGVGSNNTKHLSDKVETNDQAQVSSNNIELKSAISNTSLSAEQIAALEEELVVLKERYAAVNDEKRVLNKNLTVMQDQYNALCNRSHNTMFFYIAPLVLAILYLLISQHFS